MKVALLGENYFPTLGGIQEHIYHLTRFLRDRGVDAQVITGMPDVAEWRGPRDEPWVRRVGPARRYGVMGTVTTMTFGPGVARTLRRFLRDERFDLVHVHAPCDMGLPMLLYPLFDGPVVGTLHSPINNPHPLRRLATPYYQWVLSRLKAVVAVSEAARAAMARYATFDAVTLPNGVDTAALAAGRPMARFKDGATNVLMLGRLEPRNGPDLMFRALPAILRARPEVRLLVAGTGRDGTATHEAMVPRELRDRVVFLGPVYEERADVYATADLCVVPARSGTFSIIILEALAAGVPVVATPFIHRWEELPHFRPVHVTRDFTPEAIAAGVLALLGEDRTQRSADGRAVAARFDWASVGQSVLELYTRVLSAERR